MRFVTHFATEGETSQIAEIDKQMKEKEVALNKIDLRRPVAELRGKYFLSEGSSLLLRKRLARTSFWPNVGWK